jgi:hypothetical protein
VEPGARRRFNSAFSAFSSVISASLAASCSTRTVVRQAARYGHHDQTNEGISRRSRTS